jgi:molybdopterin molybdotransferase
MRTVADHLAAVLDAAVPVTALDVVLADTEGCVLAEDVVAPRDVPALAVADCDGYAVRADDLVVPSGPGATAAAREVVLPVVDDAAVTSADPVRLVPGTAVLIAAGAPLPFGADAVVPLDLTDRGRARVSIDLRALDADAHGAGGTLGGPALAPGTHVRRAGHDVPSGAVVLERGTRLEARHLAVAAALGRGRLRVHPRPRVVVLTIGDELVEPGRPLAPGRRHDVDGHALTAAAREAAATAVRVGPVPDERTVLREAIADQLVRADLLVLTGGLSSGPWDTVTDVLAPLGTVRFDHVAMTPGGRQGFGTVRVADDLDVAQAGDVAHATELGVGARVGDGDRTGSVPLFALPGDPLAALISYEVFVRPALRAMGGQPELYRPSVRAAVIRPFASPAGVRQFVPAILNGSPTDGYLVDPVGDPASPTLAGLARANALLVVAEDTTYVRAGDRLACLALEG